MEANHQISLQEMLDNLEKIDVYLYRSHYTMGGFRNIRNLFGGQTIGQSISAAVKTVDKKFYPNSLHCYFIKAGTLDSPILYQVDPVRNGGSYCNRFVKAVQNGTNIFACDISFNREEADSIRHQDSMPRVPPPEELLDAVSLIDERLNDPNYELTDEQRKKLERYRDNQSLVFDLKPALPSQFLRDEAGPAANYLWIKTKERLGDDPRIHQCVAAYISDSNMIATAMMPHYGQFRPGMTFSLDHSIWFHRHNFRMDDWILYETFSPVAGASRALIHGRYWTRDGRLVMSLSQEGLFRSKLT